MTARTYTLLPGRAATSATCALCGHGHRPANAPPAYTTTYAGPWETLAWCRACDRCWRITSAPPRWVTNVPAMPLSAASRAPTVWLSASGEVRLLPSSRP